MDMSINISLSFIGYYFFFSDVQMLKLSLRVTSMSKIRDENIRKRTY